MLLWYGKYIVILTLRLRLKGSSSFFKSCFLIHNLGGVGLSSNSQPSMDPGPSSSSSSSSCVVRCMYIYRTSSLSSSSAIPKEIRRNVGRSRIWGYHRYIYKAGRSSVSVLRAFVTADACHFSHKQRTQVRVVFIVLD